MSDLFKRVVVSFTLPSTGQRWHWPITGDDAFIAFIELLDRADIPYSVTPSDIADAAALARPEAAS